MKIMLSCVVLAALLALVSADGNCNFAYKSGKNCSEDFCAKLKTETDACKPKGKGPNAEKSRRDADEGAGGKGGPNAAQIQAFKDGMEKMRVCVDEKIQGEQDYIDITEFCTGTTKEENHKEVDATGNPAPRNLNWCKTTQLMSCCGMDHHFGKHHGGGSREHGGRHHGGGSGEHGGKGGHKRGGDDAAFMASEYQMMAMFA